MSREDLDRSRVAVGGWSLGSAVAIDLASRRPVAGLAAFSAFTRMADLARRQFPFLPVSALLKHRFESLNKIPLVHVPVFLAHGRADALIPSAMSRQLAGAAAGPVTFLDIPGADHNDVFLVGRDRIGPALGKFFNALPAVVPPPQPGAPIRSGSR